MPLERFSDSLNLATPLNPALLQDGGTTANQVRELIRYFTSLGADIHPSSRLHRYAAMLDGDDDTAGLTLDYALLEVLQFVAIARALQLSSQPQLWLTALSGAACGHVDQELDPTYARSRSDQFELFTMACLATAGFKVEPGEPDLRARIGDAEVAFAAKRLRSPAKLRRNLRDASEQLARNGLPGFIVIDLSFTSRVEKPVYVPRLGQQQAIAAIFADGFAQQHHRELTVAAARPYVLGILMHASIVGRSIEPVTRFVSRRWLLCAPVASPVVSTLAAAMQWRGSVPWTPVKLVGPSSLP